jgi:quercetin dioxygenase-like cupin family protein
MSIIRNSTGTGKVTTSKGPGKWFTGDAWVDVVYSDPGKIWIGNVTFNPCTRTNWHTHERGQLLRVVAGSGWICDRGEEAQRIKEGDMVWCPPGTDHWHGSDDGSCMTHLAIGLGLSEWLEPVTDEVYAKKK